MKRPDSGFSTAPVHSHNRFAILVVCQFSQPVVIPQAVRRVWASLVFRGALSFADPAFPAAPFACCLTAYAPCVGPVRGCSVRLPPGSFFNRVLARSPPALRCTLA